MSKYKGFSFSENLDLLRNIQLEASAGTGKTYSIERIVTLLIARYSLPISRILIVTFTKKAARELKERIRLILSSTLHSGVLDLGETSLEMNEEELVNIQNSYLEFEKASIFTIHSFCLNMLKAYPFESLSQFSMEMESESELTEEAVWDYMRKIGHSMDKVQLLTYKAFLEGQSFQDAVSHLTSIVNKELLEPEVELIPTNKFIDEVIQSVIEFNNENGPLYKAWTNLNQLLPDLSHLEDLGFKLAKNKIKKISLLNKIPSAADFMTLNKVLCKEKVIPTLIQFLPENLENSLKKAADLQIVEKDAFVIAVEDFLNLYEYDNDKPENNIYSQTLRASFLFHSYGEIKDRLSRKKDITGKLDFNDLIGKLHRALCGPEEFRQNQLIQEIRKRYRTVLVDEFQDTDSRQWDIFSTLFGSDDNHNYFLVGDPKQSIYGFRGADLEIYYNACGGESIDARYTLGRNFRSVSSLVHGVNLLFEQIFKKEMHCGSTVMTPFYDVQAGKTDEAKLDDQKASLEFIRIESAFDEEKGISNVKKGKDVYFKLIGFKVFDLLQREIQLKGRCVTPGDIAILTESNKDCQNLQNLLTAYSIPSVITAREKIFNTTEANEFLLFLQTLVRMDNSSIKLLLLSMFFNFTPSVIEDYELKGILDIFSAQIFHWREAVDRGKLMEVCREFFSFKEFPRIDNTFEERILSKKNGERAYTNIRQIIEYLHKEQHSAKLDTEELHSLFLHKITNESGGEENLLRLDKDSEAVQIMTMHASKGLEFPIVFFAGAMKKDIRSSFSEMYNYVHDKKRYYDFLKLEKNKISQSMDLWEERKRLYYVALTRASSKLFMPYIQNLDYSYLSSLYSSFSLEEIERAIRGNSNVTSYSLPIHSGLKIKSSDKGVLKKDILNIIDQSILDLATVNNSYLMINTELEDRFLSLNGNENLSYNENKEALDLQFHELGDNDGFQTRYRKISSYSSIIKDKTVAQHEPSISQDADRDEDPHNVVEQSSEDVLTRGAVLGELVHLLFEQLDYSLVGEFSFEDFCQIEEVENLFKTLSVRFFNNKWYNKFTRQLKQLIYNTLKTGLSENFSLSSLSNKDRLHEMEFHMTVKECNNLVLDSFKGSVDEGYLKGFIDLLFKAEGKIFVADWKTTSSPEGDDFSAYNRPVLDEIMESHHYNLQSMIYMVALCKFLISSNDLSFDYDRDFGGCYYLFVRGMNGKNDSNLGVHFFRPEKETLQEFADQFTTLELAL